MSPHCECCGENDKVEIASLDRDCVCSLTKMFFSFIVFLKLSKRIFFIFNKSFRKPHFKPSEKNRCPCVTRDTVAETRFSGGGGYCFNMKTKKACHEKVFLERITILKKP